MNGTKRNRIILSVLTIIALGFIALTLLVIILPPTLLDREFSEEIQEHPNAFLDGTMKMVSWFGYFPGSLIIVIASAIVFYIFKFKREALFVLLTSLSALVSTIIKILVNRPRPGANLVRIVQKTSQQSFPSGHVLFYVVYFGFLTLLMYQLKSISKPVRIIVASLSLLLIFSIPVSRVYLGPIGLRMYLADFCWGCFAYTR
jgi:membrane-associated phospholipid phosphatase